MTREFLYRIGLNEVGLAHFVARGLPPADLATFQEYTSRRPQSTGGQARQGYANMSVLWDSLTALQAYTLRKLIDDAETTGGSGNGTLWLTVPQSDASSPGQGWVDVSGIAIMPDWEPVQDSHGTLYENVVLRLNNVTVENDPSTVL